MFFKCFDDVEDGKEEPILHHGFFEQGGLAMRAGGLFVIVIFGEFLEAGSAAAMLVDAHDDRRVFLAIELPHAEKALEL